MQKSGQHQFTLPVPLVQDRYKISSRKGHFNCSGLLKRELNMCQVILGNALSFRSAQFWNLFFHVRSNFLYTHVLWYQFKELLNFHSTFRIISDSIWIEISYISYDLNCSSIATLFQYLQNKEILDKRLLQNCINYRWLYFRAQGDEKLSQNP